MIQELMSHIYNINITNRSFDVQGFKYLGKTVTNINLIKEEFKRKLN
jgi:hypothetical protein